MVTYAIKISEDTGDVYLSDQQCKIGAYSTIPAVQSFDSISEESCSAKIIVDALPFKRLNWWCYRKVELLRVDAVGIRKVFAGVVLSQPEEQEGVASLSIGPDTVHPVMVPAWSPVNKTDYPNAPKDSIGKLPAKIYGSCARVPAIPTQIQAITKLTKDCDLQTSVVMVESASEFANSGKIVIDGQAYDYYGKTDTSLYLRGYCKKMHKSGSSVSQYGYWTFTYTRDTVDVTSFYGGDATIYGSVSNNSGSFSFAQAPQISTDQGKITYTVEMSSAKKNSIYSLYAAPSYPVDAQGKTNGVTFYLRVPDSVGQGVQRTFTIACNPRSKLSNYEYDVLKLRIYYYSNEALQNLAYTINLTPKGGYYTAQIVVSGGFILKFENYCYFAQDATSFVQIKSVSVIWDQDLLYQTPIYALNPYNVITGPYGTIRQRALFYDAIGTGSNKITFERYFEGSIISAVYKFVFTPNANYSKANITMKVKDRIVWLCQGGKEVYNASGVTFEMDDDIDEIDVTLEDTSGLATATVVSFDRTVVYGNKSDNKSYAVMSYSNGHTLSVKRDVPVSDYGTINRAYLVIEWFPFNFIGSFNGTVNVSFGGNALGSLSLPYDSYVASVTYTELDKSEEQEIRTTSKEWSEISNPVQTVGLGDFSYYYEEDYIPTYTKSGTVWTCNQTYYPPGYGFFLDTIDAQLNVKSTNETYTFNLIEDGVIVKKPKMIIGSLGIVNIDDIAGGFTFNSPVSEKAINVVNIDNSHGTNTSFSAIDLISITWLRDFSITREYDAYSSPAEIPTGSPESPTPTIEASRIVLTSPESKKIAINRFEITNYIKSGGVAKSTAIQNKEVLLNYFKDGGCNIGVYRVYIQVESNTTKSTVTTYNMGDISVNCKRGSDNPIDILTELVTGIGKSIYSQATAPAKSWFTANNYKIGSAILNVTDTSDIIKAVCDATLLHAYDTGNGVAYIRFNYNPPDHVTVSYSDCIGGVAMGYSQPSEFCNEIKLQYQTDFVNNNYKSSKTGKITNAIGKAQIGKDQKIEINSTWINDDVTANAFIREYLTYYGQLRRTIKLKLPYTWINQIELGVAILYVETQTVYRINRVSIDYDEDSISIEAEEIPTATPTITIDG